jgi:hypothetical protein
MFCGHCGAKNAPGNRFCYNCGQALTPVCAQCGHEIGEGNRFCPNCGHPADAEATASTPAVPQQPAAPAAPTYSPPPAYTAPTAPPPAAWSAPAAAYVPPAVAQPMYPPPPPAATQGYMAEPTISGYAPSLALAQPAMDYQGGGGASWRCSSTA